jgi:hypothetical protein
MNTQPPSDRDNIRGAGKWYQPSDWRLKRSTQPNVQYPPWLYAIIFVFVLGAATKYIYDYAIVPREAQKLIDNAPLVTAADLARYAGQDKVIRFEVLSGKAKSSLHNLVYRRVDGYELTGSSGHHRSYRWVKKYDAPSLVLLTCADSEIPLSVKGDSIDSQFQDLYFRDYGNKTNAPLDDETGYVITRPSIIYQEVGIPADKKLSVLGCVEKEGSGYKLTSFRYKGEVFSPVISSLSMPKLVQYLDTDVDAPAGIPEINHTGKSPELPHHD